MIARTFLFEKLEVYPKGVSLAEQRAALVQEFPRAYRVPAALSGNIDISAAAANPVAVAEIH